MYFLNFCKMFLNNSVENTIFQKTHGNKITTLKSNKK